MGRLSFEQAPSIDAAVLDFLSGQDACLQKPAIRLQKSSNKHALCQYIEPSTKTIRNKWVLVRKNPENPEDHSFQLEDLSMMHAMFLGADIEDTSDGLTLRIRGPLNFPGVLRIAQDEEGQSMILVEHEGQLVIVDWLHVNLDDPKNVLVQAVGVSSEDGSSKTVQHSLDLSGLGIPLDMA